MDRFNFRQELFWDVDLSQMDPGANAAFIIGRVFDFGDLADIKIVKDYYGLARLKEVALSHAFASPKHLNFWSEILKVPVNNLSCTKRPLPPLPALFSMS